MPPVRTDVVRRINTSPRASTHGHYTRYAKAGGQASDFIASHCRIDAAVLAHLPIWLRAQTQQILGALNPVETFCFAGISGLQSISAGATPRHRVQLAALRCLVALPPRTRRTVAKQGYALLGASLPPRERAAGVNTLALAACFGSARLAQIVRTCVPLVNLPRRRAAMLQCLWHDVGPERVPLLLAMCQPALQQRRQMPDLSAKMMGRILDDSEALRQSRGATIEQVSAAPARVLPTHLETYIGDLDENVMQAGRMRATCDAILLIRAQLPDALPAQSALRALQYFILGTACSAGPALRTTCGLAWTTLTGFRPPFEHAPTSGRPGPSEAADAPLLAELDSHIVDQYPWFAGRIRLCDDGTDHILLSEVLSLVWQVLSCYADPNGCRSQKKRVQDNLRHSLLRALAECQVDGPVCSIGKSQRIVSVLQGYLPFAIDSVENEAEPLAVVTYMVQGLANGLDPYLDTSHPLFRSLDGVRKSAFLRGEVQRFLREAARTADALFKGRPEDHARFTEHLTAAVKYDYACFLSDPLPAEVPGSAPFAC